MFGQGVPRDYQRALVWLRKGAEQGDASAEHYIGWMYFSGNRLEKHYGQAAEWESKAARQGYGPAQDMLSLMYTEGVCVTQDYVIAYMWLNLAATQFSGDVLEFMSSRRDQLAKKMTVEQIATAQKLTREWKPVPNTK